MCVLIKWWINGASLGRCTREFDARMGLACAHRDEREFVDEMRRDRRGRERLSILDSAARPREREPRSAVRGRRRYAPIGGSRRRERGQVEGGGGVRQE